MDSLRVDPDAPVATGAAGSNARRAQVLIGVGALLVLLMVASVFVGSGGIGVGDTWNSLWHPSGSTTDVIVRDYRVPRTLLAVLAGIALGVAGAVIQALTRNPLADPGILGVNGGAYFMVVVGAAFFGATGIVTNVLWGLAGAMLAATVVYAIGSSGRSGGTPARMVLAGVALGSMLSGVSFGISLLLPSVFDKVRFWQVGSVQGREIDSVIGVLPFIVVGLLLALALARPLNALALGDDLARSLGTRIGTTRMLSFIAITLLCGACTAAVGPILFVGLMVPHAARAFMGADQRWLLPTCLLVGPLLFLVSDMIGRVAVSSELPVGMVTSFLGAPLLIWLVRRDRAGAR
ncbi:MAG: iron chelate uptake ABC transporter family permease subunit [Thermoleophilia bacterium]